LPTDHRIEFQQEVFNEQQKLLTVGKVVLYFIKASTREKTAIPPALYEKLAPYFNTSSTE
jgi:acyl-CoA thioester hydrolase